MGEILVGFVVLSIMVGLSVAYGPDIIKKIKLTRIIPRKRTKGNLITKKNLNHVSREEIDTFANKAIRD